MKPQKVQLVKAKADAMVDVASLGVFAVVAYFVLNPGAYDRATAAVQRVGNAIMHRLSIWQAAVSIRSLPETDTE